MTATAYRRGHSATAIGSRVSCYWFRPGGEISLGVCRIAIFSALLHSLLLNYHNAKAVSVHLSTVSATNYIPKGILKLFGTLPHSTEVMTTVWWIAYVACIMAIVGLVTRPAMIVATLSTLSLLSLRESFGPLWSHGFNVNACAALALMFASAGATLSIDRIATKATGWWRFGGEAPPNSYYWGVLAAQIAVAFFYFGAFWAKMYHGGLSWVFSDNMRIMVGITWDHPYVTRDLPWYIQTLISSPILWKAAALAHLFTQALPLLAATHIRHPLLRLIEGAVFVGGVYALYLVMTVWDPQWLWLGAVFVDWEWVVSKISTLQSGSAAAVLRPGFVTAAALIVPSSYVLGTHGGNPPQQALAPLDQTQKITLAYVCVFLGYYAFVWIFQVGQKHLNYPFSSFDFYAANYASPPYNQHKHHTFLAGGVRFRGMNCEALSKYTSNGHPVFECEKGAVGFDRRVGQDSSIFELYRVQKPEAIAGALETIAKYTEQRYPDARPSQIDLLVRLWQYPPYPQPMKPVISHELLRGVRLVDGSVLSCEVSVLERKTRQEPLLLSVDPSLSNVQLELKYYHDPWAIYGPSTPRNLPGRWRDGRTFEIDVTALDQPSFTSIVIRYQNRGYEFWGPIIYHTTIAPKRKLRRPK